MLEAPLLYLVGGIVTAWLAHRKGAPKVFGFFWPATLPFLLIASFGDWLDPNIQ